MTRRALWVVVLVACRAPVAPAPSAQPPSPPPAPPREAPRARVPAAAEIVAKMEQVYRSASSYVDRGDVSTVTARGRRSDSTFEIAFVRDRVLRLEFREQGRSYVVWWDGAQAIVRDDWSGSIAKTTLALAIDKPRGVLRPSATTAASMLLPDVLDGSELSSLRDLQVVGTERIGDRACWRLQGTQSENTRVTFWVDQATYLLRRTDIRARIRLGKFSTFTSDSLTNHDPVLDQPVDVTSLPPP